VPEKDLILAASMDLRWFNYSSAQRFLALAAAEGLVRREGDRLRIAFDPATVELPLTYAPPADLLTAVPEPPDTTLFGDLLTAIQAAGAVDSRTAVARVNEKQERQDVSLEVAALLVLAELGGDARAFAPRVLAGLRAPGDLDGPGR
jgi:hypothetical protein